MKFKEAAEKAKNASFRERYHMLKNGTDIEKLAAIPHFDTSVLMDTLKDECTNVRLNALVQICKRDDFYDLARGTKNIVALANDSVPSIRQEVMNIINQYNGRFSLAKDNGNPACDTAYWDFIETAEKLANDPVPEVAEMAKTEIERHYDRYPYLKPKEQEQDKGQEQENKYSQYFNKNEDDIDI